jgi:hypothetical protein
LATMVLEHRQPEPRIANRGQSIASRMGRVGDQTRGLVIINTVPNQKHVSSIKKIAHWLVMLVMLAILRLLQRVEYPCQTLFFTSGARNLGDARG